MDISPLKVHRVVRAPFHLNFLGQYERATGTPFAQNLAPRVVHLQHLFPTTDLHRAIFLQVLVHVKCLEE
jgi:hypothetical protein